MCFGSILINSNIGICKRLAIETVEMQAIIVLNYSVTLRVDRDYIGEGGGGGCGW